MRVCIALWGVWHWIRRPQTRRKPCALQEFFALHLRTAVASLEPDFDRERSSHCSRYTLIR